MNGPELLAFGAIISALLLGGCAGDDSGDDKILVVFHAGSLAVPLREVSELFMKENPGIKVQSEGAGSRDCARKIVDLERRCDVLASADHSVVTDLLMPDHAAFNIHFATNEMVIAYTDRSRLADKINSDNWYEILLSERVLFGRSDPDRDPCGYRTVMVIQLAERQYGVSGLAEKLLARGGKKYIRPKETDLLALLEMGEIDYLFIYRSVAGQHGLEMVELDEEINLSSARLNDAYGRARVSVSGKEPGKRMTKVGAAIVYSVTIPTDAPNPSAAEKYVSLLLSPRGRAIMERHGQSGLDPPKVEGAEHLPPLLSAQLAEAGRGR